MKKTLLIATTLVASISTTSLYAACAINIDMGGNKIAGLADATSSSDAVSLSQLTGILDEYTTSGYFDTGVVTDIEGNEYTTKKIGTQVWMTQNLRTTKYHDGSDIPRGYYDESRTPISNWNNGNNHSFGIGTMYDQTQPGFSDDDLEKYGFVYQWGATMNGEDEEGAQGVCMEGWHVPADFEWKALEEVLSVVSGTGGFDATCLNDTGKRYGATDDGSACAAEDDQIGTQLKSTIFSTAGGALAGYGIASAGRDRGSIGRFWSSTSDEDNPGLLAYSRSIDGDASIERIARSKPDGYSVRCVQDS